MVVESRWRGRVLARERYEDGRRHGESQRFWPGGTKRSQGSYRAGRRDGEWFEFTPDGRLDRVRTGLYRDGLRIGGIRGFNEWLGSP
jgi:antitoxin component YwqK of YwqJK toxin-antitoxin module